MSIFTSSALLLYQNSVNCSLVLSQVLVPSTHISPHSLKWVIQPGSQPTSPLCILLLHPWLWGDCSHQGLCGKLSNGPQRHPHPKPWTWQRWPHMAKGTLKTWLAKDLGIGRLFWIIWMDSKCNHEDPYKSETEGTLTLKEKALRQRKPTPEWPGSPPAMEPQQPL